MYGSYTASIKEVYLKIKVSFLHNTTVKPDPKYLPTSGGRYFLELNTLDELFPFHRKFYKKITEKILRRKENKWFRQWMRKSLYVFYAAANTVRNNKLKVQFQPKGYAKAL